MKRVLLGGDVLLPGGRLERADVLVVAGRIAQVGRFEAPTDAAAIDCRGRVVLPGFLDLHLNGFGGVDFFEADACRRVEPALWRTGVTGFLATSVAASREHMRRFLSSEWLSPSFLGFHLEGNFVNPRRPGCQDPSLMQPLEAVFDWLDVAQGRVRLVTVAPEVTQPETIRHLADRGVVVSIGHSLATYEQAHAALAAGAQAFTHLFNANPPLHHRQPGLVGAALEAEAASCMVIADGHHLHPAMLNLILRLKGPDRMLVVTDGTAASGAPAGAYRLGGLELQSDGERVTLADGTLAGSCLTLDTALANLLAWGVPLASAARLISETPARLLGLSDRGQIAAGRRADLVVWEAHGRVRLTLLGGETVFSVAHEHHQGVTVDEPGDR